MMATVANSVGMLVRITVMSASTTDKSVSPSEYPGDDKLRARDVGEYVGEVGGRRRS